MSFVGERGIYLSYWGILRQGDGVLQKPILFFFPSRKGKATQRSFPLQSRVGKLWSHNLAQNSLPTLGPDWKGTQPDVFSQLLFTEQL